MITEAAVEAAAYALFLEATPDSELQWYDIGFHDQDELMRTARKILEAATPHMLAGIAVEAVLALHREMECRDEDNEPVGGSYCEECKDLDDHSGERVHEVYPCMTVREITAALAGTRTFTAMREQIEASANRPTP